MYKVIIKFVENGHTNHEYLNISEKDFKTINSAKVYIMNWIESDLEMKYTDEQFNLSDFIEYDEYEYVIAEGFKMDSAIEDLFEEKQFFIHNMKENKTELYINCLSDLLLD